MLPGLRLAVALGEAGVRLLRADGRTLRHWDAPATALVTSDEGTRLLAVRQFDQGAVSVRALDLLTGTQRILGEWALGCWADTFDGLDWVAAGPSGVMIVDTLAGSPTILGRLDVPPGPVVAVARSSRSSGASGEPALAVAVVTGPGTLEVVRFRPPGFTPGRRTRETVDRPVVLTPTGRLVGDVAVADDGHSVRVEGAESAWSATVNRLGSGAGVAQVRLAGSARAGGRLDEGHAVFADHLGRVETVDLRTGARGLSVRLQV
jgi:hypothetical protein